MLRFFGHFKESVVESRLENSRLHKLNIFYYLEDKSIMITEPKLTNSGTPQGAFLNRQMVLKADGSGCPFMPTDFGVGQDIAIYGRAMTITDCDEYTREFFKVSQFEFSRLKSEFLVLNLVSRESATSKPHPVKPHMTTLKHLKKKLRPRETEK